MGRLKDAFDRWVDRHGGEQLEYRDGLPVMRPAPALRARFDQCDETCTADCGHCKGAGAPKAGA